MAPGGATRRGNRGDRATGRNSRRERHPTPPDPPRFGRGVLREPSMRPGLSGFPAFSRYPQCGRKNRRDRCGRKVWSLRPSPVEITVMDNPQVINRQRRGSADSALEGPGADRRGCRGLPGASGEENEARMQTPGRICLTVNGGRGVGYRKSFVPDKKCDPVSADLLPWPASLARTTAAPAGTTDLRRRGPADPTPGRPARGLVAPASRQSAADPWSRAAAIPERPREQCRTCRPFPPGPVPPGTRKSPAPVSVRKSRRMTGSQGQGNIAPPVSSGAARTAVVHGPPWPRSGGRFGSRSGSRKRYCRVGWGSGAPAPGGTGHCGGCASPTLHMQ